MKNKSFFEYLGIADVERIHSQMIAWILSPDCLALDKSQKDTLLQVLFNLNEKSAVKNIQTERNGIDILIETNTLILVIENKIKSSQHSDQLKKYKSYCDTTFPKLKTKYYFLTLIGEQSNDDNWINITYRELRDELKGVKLKLNNNHRIIISEYLIFLNSLVEVVDDFKKNPAIYNMVFTDGKKTKADKLDTVYKTANEKFIASNQLETILQKCYLSKIVENINHKGIISDTFGNALIDFPIKKDIEYNGKHYSTGLQFQDGTFKFIFFIQSENYKTSEKEWITGVIPKMNKLSNENFYGYKKLNKPNAKAYVSISKKLHQRYWEIDIKQLVTTLRSEIKNCKKMTTTLVKLISEIK